MADQLDTDEFRRRQTQAFIQQMQGQALTPKPAANPLSSFLNPLIQAYTANAMEKDMLAQDEKMKAQRSTDMSSELAKFIKTYQGEVGQTLTDGQASELMNNNVDTAAGLKDRVAPDPAAAITAALASRQPDMQAIGSAQLPQLLKVPEKVKDKYEFPNGSMVRVPGDGGTPQIIGRTDADGPWREEVINIPGAPPQLVRRNLTTGKAEALGGGPGTTVNVTPDGTIEQATAKAIGSKLPETLQAAKQTITDAQQRIDTADRIYAAAADPAVITGFGANLELGAKSLAKKLGWKDEEDSVAKTQTLFTDVAGQTLAASQKLKGALSDGDMIFLRDVTAGTITKDAKTLQRVADLAKRQAHYEASQALDQYQSVEALPGGKDAARLYPMPKFEWQMEPSRFRAREGNSAIFDPVDVPTTAQPGSPVVPAKPGTPLPDTATTKVNGRTVTIRRITR